MLSIRPDHEDTASPRCLRDRMSSTDRYYDEHANEYFERTVTADLSHLYDRFLSIVSAGGRILDAGCGSGRDLRAFAQRGFCAMGIDASPALVELAKCYSDAPCRVERFEDIAYESCFDGIWACASLLHVPKTMLASVLRKLHRALISDGAIFFSVQNGEGERQTADGRFYAYYQPAEFLRMVEEVGFVVDSAWSTEDALPERTGVHWINVLAHRI